MWCRSHPSQWNSLTRHYSSWTIELLKRQKDRIDAEKLKEARDICGVVSNPVWDFVEPKNYIFPVLHVKIGLVNNVLDKFYDWVEDHGEVASAEEKMCRKRIIILDTELSKAVGKLEAWKNLGGTQWTRLHVNLSQVQNALKSRLIGPNEGLLVEQQLQQFQPMISSPLDIKKALESDVNEAEGFFKFQKTVQGGPTKNKINTPISVDLENILQNQNISAAAYHGGKLNGVDCHEL